MKNKQIVIYQDQRIAEEFCNFNCEYCGGFCPSEYSIKKDNHGNLTVPDEWYEIIKRLPIEVKTHFEKSRTLDQFYGLSHQIMEKTSNLIQSDILKISGGELTIYSKLSEFVSLIHNKYLSIQILSNGYNISQEEIIKYRDMRNVNFQISLDGVSPEANYSKTHSKFITNKVLENINFMLKNNIGVEINCVLTKYNTDKFFEFLGYFKNAKNFMIVPRPVRGGSRKLIDFSKEQVLIFEKDVMNNYEKYQNILPPKKYFERLIKIMKNGKRIYSCYIPYFIQSIDGYGNFEMCPLGLPFDTEKNILDDSINNTDILLNSSYSINNNYKLCNYCIVQFEMLNLYVEDEISEKELMRMPSLNNDIIMSHINEIKKNILDKFIDDLKEKIKNEYLIEINKIEKNEDSTDGNVYIINTEKGKYVAKLYDDLEHTKAMIELHSDLYTNNFHVPEVIKSNKNKGYIKLSNGKYIVLYSFLSGLQISDKFKVLPADIIKEIAVQLKKIHDITCGINRFKIKEIPFYTNCNVERKSVLHFDLTRSNIFYDENNNCKIGFIDFDDAKYGASVCDVAIAAANLFFSKTRGVDVDGLMVFIDSYYEGNEKLKSMELPHIKKFALKWIDYVMDGNEFDTSTTESFEVRKNLIEKNMNFSDINND